MAIISAALAYADDSICIAPSAMTKRGMLAFCDEFTSWCCVKFNNTKSKCMTCNYSKQVVIDASAPLPSFAIGGNPIENTERSLTSFKSCLNAHLTGNDNILARRNSFIGQATNVICNLPIFETLCLRWNVAVIMAPNSGTLQII